MATVFPFDRIPKIPVTVLTALLPIFLKQKSLLNKIASKLEQRVDSLSTSTSCGDAQVTSIKHDLDQLRKVAENLQRVADFVDPLSVALRTAATTANVIVGIQLLIPAVPGVPEGPKTQLLTASAELIQNVAATLNILNTIITGITYASKRVNSVVAVAESKLNSICNDAEVVFNGADTERDILASLYPSEFYSDVNVSGLDIDNRLDEIQRLVDSELNVLDNVNEAPSKVFRGAGPPQNALGTIDDYYIDTVTQQVYGPKTNQNSWT